MALPNKIVMLKAVVSASDHVHTRLYEAGEVHEVGSTSMPDFLAQSLIDDGSAKASTLDVTPVEEAVDDTLDAASGRHRVTAVPEAVLLQRKLDALQQPPEVVSEKPAAKKG